MAGLSRLSPVNLGFTASAFRGISGNCEINAKGLRMTCQSDRKVPETRAETGIAFHTCVMYLSPVAAHCIVCA